jgi:hypothetical protein
MHISQTSFTPFYPKKQTPSKILKGSDKSGGTHSHSSSRPLTRRLRDRCPRNRIRDDARTDIRECFGGDTREVEGWWNIVVFVTFSGFGYGFGGGFACGLYC